MVGCSVILVLNMLTQVVIHMMSSLLLVIQSQTSVCSDRVLFLSVNH